MTSMVAPVAVAAVWSREGRAGALVDVAVRHIVELDTVLHLMVADDIRQLPRELVVQAVVAGFIEPDAAGNGVRGHRAIGHAPGVDRWHLVDVVQRARPESLDQEVAGQDTVVADGLIVAAVGERAEAGRVFVEQRAPALRSVFALRRVAEERGVEPVRVTQLIRGLCRVRRRPPFPVESVRVRAEERESGGTSDVGFPTTGRSLRRRTAGF
jgi:hypothetical protein